MSSVASDEHADEQNSSHECLGQLVVTRDDATILLKFAEKSLDEIALAIEREVDLSRHVAPAADDRYMKLLQRENKFPRSQVEIKDGQIRS